MNKPNVTVNQFTTNNRNLNSGIESELLFNSKSKRKPKPQACPSPTIDSGHGSDDVRPCVK